MSTPDLFRLLLLLLLGLLGVIAGILPSAFDKQSSLRGKSFIFGLGALCGILLLIGGSFIGTAKADQNAEWIQNVAWTLGIGYAFSLPTMLYFLITKEQAETQSPRNLLLKAVQEEVTQRLETSLHNQKMIDLAAKELPHHVGGMPISEKPQPISWFEQPKKWVSEFLRMPNLVISTTDDGEDIATEEKIIDVFKNKDGKLLILGEPGAGKSTTLLDLAKDLCVEAVADENKPIPIIVDLFSWKKNRLSLPDWLAVELKNKYGVRADITKELLDNHQLLPLLDGFDELEENRQVSCIRQINEFLETDARAQHLVVCSRLKEFERCNTPLRLNGAVCLQPLELAQMQKYLREVGCLNLWDGIKNTSDLLDLAKSPLLLTLMALASGSISISDWQKCNTPAERRRYLFDSYIKQMFKGEIKRELAPHYSQGKEPREADTLKWLVWLAKQLKDKNQTEFLIEKMQPSLLSAPLQPTYDLGIGLIFGLILGCGNLLTISVMTELRSILIITTFYGFIVGMIGGVFGKHIGLLKLIIPSETLKWSWVNTRYNPKGKFISGLIGGIIGGLGLELFITLIYEPLSKPSNILIDGFRFGMVYGICFGAVIILAQGLSGSEIRIRKYPNQGIWQSAQNVVLFFSLAMLGVWLMTNLLNTISSYEGARLGLLAGIGLGTITGGIACIQHLILRLVLCVHRDIPWNYAKFLNYASERLFMQRIGGRYRFIHDLLREHFANM